MRSSELTEGQLLSAISKDLSPEDKRFFLTIEAEGVVMIDGMPDGTDTNMMHNGVPDIIDHYAPWEDQDDPVIRNSVSGSSRSRSTGHVPTVPSRPTLRPRKTKFTHRRHYRIVFLEVGTPLHDMDTLTAVYNGLQDVVRGEWDP